MSPRTTRLTKEARALFRPWCAVVILCALPLFHIRPALTESSIPFGCLGVAMLATLGIGSEFQHRTFSLLLSQPISRMKMWGEKMCVVSVAVLSATLVFCIGWRSALAHDPKLWVFIGVYLIATVPSATYWTLAARSTIGGFLLNSLFLYPLILIGGNWEEILGPHPSPARTIGALSIVSFAALGYAGVMLWLGGRRLARFQVSGGMVGDDLVMAGSSLMPEALAGWLRCRPSGAVLNLIRKELRLLRPVWLMTALSAVYLACLSAFRLLPTRESDGSHPGAIRMILYIPVILLPPVAAMLAGGLSLWEEKQSGTQAWHMTLPVSARRQWLIKLGMAVFTGLVCAVVLPVIAVVLVGIAYGSPFRFVEQAMGGLIVAGGSTGLAGGSTLGLLFLYVDQAMPGLLLTALLLILASFWCACAVNGTVRAALLFVPAMGAVLYAGRFGGQAGPKLAGLVVSSLDLFKDFRFIKAISGLQSLVMGASPLRVVTLLLVPTLLFAVLRSYRLFRAPRPDSIFSVLRNLAPLAVTAFLTVFALAAFASLMDVTNGRIVTSGETRKYLLYVPKSYDRSKPTPLVISLHPAASWPAAEMEISRWNELADENGFLVVYPSGSGEPRVWPMGPRSLGVDVQFISDLIDTLETQYNIDPKRVYADGMSNGGGMAFALSCKLPERIAAVGAVAAAQMLPWDQCGDSRPVATVAFHGTVDPLAPYQGGTSPVAPGELPNIRDWTARVARRNRCKGDPSESRITASVRRLAYTNCSDHADVMLYTVEGGGHTWPGGKELPEWLGRTTREISATKVMWAFFVQHPRGP